MTGRRTERTDLTDAAQFEVASTMSTDAEKLPEHADEVPSQSRSGLTDESRDILGDC